MKKLIIVGTSSNSRLARFYFEQDTDYKVVAYAVESSFIKEREFDNLPVIDILKLEYLYPKEKFDVFVAVGYKNMNGVRQKLYNLIKGMGYFMPNYISPKCSFLTNNKIGDNNFILEDNTVQPFVNIGSNNVLWSGNHIGHDVIIGSHNFISSHVVISGFVKISDNVFLGVNSSINDGINILSYSLIGSGSVITKDTTEKSVWVSPRSIKLEKSSLDIKL